MRAKIECDFYFEGMDDCSKYEIEDYLRTVLKYGTETSCSEIDDVVIEIDK